MTKYILNGGAIKKDKELAKKYFAEVFSGLGEDIKILICCFAEPREDWEEKFKVDLEKFPSFFVENIKVSMKLAYPDTFAEDIRNSDVLYIHGGDDYLLMYWLRQFDIPKIWEGKVVATSSASSDAMSRYFWPGDWRKPQKGLGILPIKFIPHFRSDYGSDSSLGLIDWDKAYKELEKFGESDLPIYAIKEGEFVVIEK